MRPETVLLNVHVSKELHTALKVAVAQAGTTMSAVIRQLLLLWLEERRAEASPKEPSS